jgi:hypothetical protein
MGKVYAATDTNLGRQVAITSPAMTQAGLII